MITFDPSQVLAALDTLAKESSAVIERQFQAIGANVWRLVNADRSFGGNRLRRSIGWKKVTENRLRVFTAPQLKHASYVNDGTRPHDIVARNGKTLRFISGGAVVFRKRVRHPGTRPTLFFERATDKAFATAEVELEQRLSVPVAHFNR